MHLVLRRLAAAFSLASLALSWPLAFVSAQQAAATPIAIIGDSHNAPLSGTPNILPPMLSGYNVVGTMCNAGWSVAQLHNGGGANVSASCFRNQSAVSYLNSLSTKPKAIIVIAGGNGVDTASELTSFVADLKTVAPTIIWVGPFYAKDASTQTVHTANSQTQKSTLPGLGVNWIEQIAVNPSFPYQNDNVHFTIPAGYQQVAQQLAPQILQYLAAAAGSAAAAANAQPAPTAPPVTDALGRTQDDINNAIAVQCADTNPVFPVHLGVAIGGTSEVNGLTEYINVVYRYMTAIVLVVTIVMVTYGGFRYLMAATPLGVSDGKDIIKNGIVGMVLVLGAYVILNTINPATTVLQFTRPPADIRCAPYAASLGYVPGGNDQCSVDADCGAGNRCVMTTVVAQNVTASENLSTLAAGAGGGAVFAGPLGAVVGGVGSIGTMIYRTADGVHKCTNGQAGSPCSEDSDCKNGTVCVDDWKICVRAEGNGRGTPCDTSHDNMCASGTECQATDHESWREDWAMCRGTTQPLSWEAIRANSNRAPLDMRCEANEDCTPGNLCSGPAGAGVKYCIPASGQPVVTEQQNPTPCFITRDNGMINPVHCGGNGSSAELVSCVICGTDNKWQRLNLTNDPNRTRIGACAENSLVGTTCRR